MNTRCDNDNPNRADPYDDFPGDAGRLLKEIRDNPDARSLMHSLVTVPDVSVLSYDERRARLAPDSIVQMLIYEAIDDPSQRDRFVAALMDRDTPPAP